MTKKRLVYLIIHCTATPEGREVTVSDIRSWHLSKSPKGRGWKQVGYTDLIHLGGSVDRLADNNEDCYVDSWEITNGVAGINPLSRHIVYAGGLDKFGKTKDTRTPEQKMTLENYVKNMVKNYPFIKVAGHNQFAAKDCPSFNVPMWLKEIGVNENNIYKK